MSSAPPLGGVVEGRLSTRATPLQVLAKLPPARAPLPTRSSNRKRCAAQTFCATQACGDHSPLSTSFCRLAPTPRRGWHMLCSCLFARRGRRAGSPYQVDRPQSNITSWCVSFGKLPKLHRKGPKWLPTSWKNPLTAPVLSSRGLAAEPPDLSLPSCSFRDRKRG